MADDDDELARRVKEELAAEGEDEHSIWQMAWDALERLIELIAKRLRRAKEDIRRALRRLGGG
jgi:YD repeat-containing protein